jgi:hypothetical protein
MPYFQMAKVLRKIKRLISDLWIVDAGYAVPILGILASCSFRHFSRWILGTLKREPDELNKLDKPT